MKLIANPWNKSALRRLILSFICILLPLYILAIVIYNWGIGTLQTEISRSMTTQVSQYFRELENEFSRIRGLQLDVLSDTNLNSLSAIPEYYDPIEKLQRMLSLQQRLNAIRNSSAYIEEVHAYIPAIGKDISALTVSDFDRDAYNEFMNAPDVDEAQVVNIRGKMYMVAGYPYLLSLNKREPIFIVAIELSLGKVREAMHAMRNSPEEGLLFTSPQFSIAASPAADLNDTFVQRIVQGQETTDDARVISVDGQRYLTVNTASNFFGAVLIKYIPESAVFQPLEKFRNWFLLFAAVSLVIILVYSLYVYKFIHQPLDRLAKAFRKVELGDVGVQIRHESRDEFHYIYTRFNAMLDNIKSLIDQVYKQRILTQKAELKQLQSQINPHFLYNSFFILNTMARLGDYEQVERFANQLGEYFQFVTRNNNDEVPLGKEVQHAKVYAEIQGMRFANRVTVTFGELPEHTGHVMVPRLILQPLIENAFEHGLEKKAAAGRLDVRFEKEDNKIVLIVEDNGEQLDDDGIERVNRDMEMHEEVEVTGLINIHQRIRLKFGPASGLSVSRSEWGGVKATITIELPEGRG
ncbi:HAMP domain-containing protein [Paenibacillus antri]|uniref:HAMP domain-containing protein n=1 Tax=Paenibacillus antri TaxID=2582848 RepID=A0A5R9FZ16_9BACL|nr:histidine kinase [Paenibacillus antri]TLS49302.1 HAMP domain-containing protein [Paenibacillus antri]